MQRRIAELLFIPSEILTGTPTGDANNPTGGTTEQVVDPADPIQIDPNSPVAPPIVNPTIDISSISDDQLRRNVQIAFDNTPTPPGKVLRFFYADDGRWRSGDANLELFSLQNAGYKQGVELLARQLIDTRTTIVSVDGIQTESSISGILNGLLIK